MRPYRLFNQLFCMLVSLTAPRPQYHFFSSPAWVCACTFYTTELSFTSIPTNLNYHSSFDMLKHLNPSMGFGRVYGEWVLALWQSRNGDYILWKDRVPSIHSSCIWFIFFPIFYCAPFFSLSIHLFCYSRFVWRRSFEVLWMHECRICICVHV